MTQGTVSFPLTGGLDLITPPGKMPPGRCIAALNYEPVASGYQRLAGFERYDGHPAPSDATYWRVNFTIGGFTGAAQPIVGAKLWRGASNHFYVAAVVISSGTWAGGDAAGYFVATQLVGTFTGAGVNNASSGGQQVAVDGTITLEYDFGTTLNATYLAAARSVTRDLISAVAGPSAIRGIWGFNGDIFTVADNDPATPTAGVFYKASTTGWATVNNLTRLDFTVDTATQTMPVYSSKTTTTITNSSGGASKGTLRGVIITSTVGTVNTGYLLISSYVASSWTAGAIGIWYAGTATRVGTSASAATTTATIPAGGRYFFLNHNFYGSEDRAAMYMVNGVGKALVYDGIGYSEIATGMTTDTPTRLASHQGSLFLSFPGGSLQSSTAGEPQSFDPLLGASEIGVGSDITDLISANKTTLAIFAEASISVLYGHDSADYQLEVLTQADGDEAVALPYTAQRLGNVLYMDNVGIRSISATAAYGNFNLGAVSRLIEPLLRDYRKDGVDPVASLTWKRKDQYWVFFDNGTALVLYVGLKEPQILPLNLGFTVTCASTITINGIERAFVGTSTGYVMELDKGTSFDGSNVEHYFRLPFNTFGSSEIEKRVHKVTLNLEASGTTTLSVDMDFDYGSVVGLASQTLTITTGGGALDGLGSNESYYASQIETQAETYLDGVARNFSLKVSGLTSAEEPHTATSVTFHLSQRGLKR